VAFGVPVPQPDPKALAWMQAEAAAPRERPGVLSKPMSLLHSGPLRERVVAARTGPPNMQPDTDTTSLPDVLTGGAKSQIGAGGGSGATGNTLVVDIATPSSGASGGTTVENPDASATPAPDPNAAPADPAPAADSSAASGSAANPDPNAAPADPNQKPAPTDTKKESSSKKKKGLRKVIPW